MSGVTRRDFLKTVAVGSAAAVSAAVVPSFVGQLVPEAHAVASGIVGFQFAGQSIAPTLGSVQARISMSGEGKVDPVASQVTAGGSFTQFDNGVLKDPKPIISQGTWTGERLSSLKLVGTWGEGPFAAGEIEMDVTLHQDFPSRAEIPGKMRLVSNIEAAGLTTGLPQGFTLNIPESTIGPFVPSKKKSKKKAHTMFTVGKG